MKIVRFDDIPSIPASHEDPRDPGVMKKILFDRDDLPEGKIQMINWATIKPGEAFRAHFHEDMAELFIILTGVATVRIDKEEQELHRGDAVIVPENGVHEMKNIGERDMEYIVVGISRQTGGKTQIAS